MKRRINSVACALPALTLLLASCTADKIEVPDKELYTREFIKQFGTFSSDAGWNSATRVTANIDPSIVAGGTDIKVFTAWPTNPDCRIVASFPASTTNFEFDYPDGLEYAYVQVLDANGTSVYGGYTRVTDGQLNVGQAGRASRADEPTGGSHYTVYTYDLTNNPALGTFLVDEKYNRDFWKNNGLGLYSEYAVNKPEAETPPTVDTSTQTELFNGEYNCDKSDGSPWGQAIIIDNGCSYFKNSNNNHFEVIVTGKVNDSSKSEIKFELCRNDDPNNLYSVKEDITTGFIEPNINDDGTFTQVLELHRADATKLREYPLSVKGANVTINNVKIKGLEYEIEGSFSTTKEYQVSMGGFPSGIGWGGTTLTGFGMAESNRIELIIKFKVKDIYNGQHMFVLKDKYDNDIVGSGNLKTAHFNETDEFTRKFTIKGEDIQKLQDNGKIAGENIDITDIKYRNLDYVYDIKSGTAKFSDLFRLYGLTTSPGVSDMEGYKNNALKPYNDYQPEGYSAHDLVSLVGSKKGVFHEEVNDNTGECNLKYFKDKLHPEEGVDYQLTKDGEVSLDYFFGCASAFNSFGYFYYSDEEASLLTSNPDEFAKKMLQKPKFILMYRAFPHSNIKIMKNAGEWGQLTDLATIGDNNIVQNGDDEGKDKSDNWQHCGEFTHIVDDAEAAMENGTAETDRAKQYPRFQSANYRLVYFSPDQFESDGVTLKSDKKGSYIFPAGTHIAFFVINGGQYALQKEGTAGFKIDHTRISFSRPLLNKYLGNVFNAGGHSHSANTTPSTNIAGPNAEDPWTPFVTYKWGGDIIMGVEDYFARTHDGINGSDHDMNDMLFRVKGEFVRDREELNPETPKGQNWIIACEDLGGTHDFDFNDVVFGVTHVAGEPTATVTALASGGTLPVYLESIYPQTSHSSSGVTREDGETYYTLTPEDAGDGEFHKWWNANNHHSGIINATGWKGAGKSIQIEVDDRFTLSNTETKPGHQGIVSTRGTNMGGFRVRVHRNDKDYVTITAPQYGDGYEAPQMFLVPHTWYWPQENQFILDVYPDFNNWGEGVDWWNKATGKDGHNVIKHNWVPTTPATTTK